MRLVIQRVDHASVTVDGTAVGAIKTGVLVLFAAHKNDTPEQTLWLASKLANLRIFPGTQDKMNLSLLDIKGEVLIVSQFTLYGDCTQGRRPEFTASAPPEMARTLYEKFIQEVRAQKLLVETGIFGAKMEVALPGVTNWPLA